MQRPFLSPGSCEMSAFVLNRVSRLRAALADLERSLQEKHLSCCVFPELSHPEEITRTLFQLSIRRIGALVAVERQMILDDYAKTGTLIDAELSASLLLSLFYPGNPLHDGAVIIRKERIIAGGCILPLSADHDAFKAMGLGMRHRAGVGLSQVSDAMVFIVSEETGIVSLAVRGQMFRDPLFREADALTRAACFFDQRRASGWRREGWGHQMFGGCFGMVRMTARPNQ